MERLLIINFLSWPRVLVGDHHVAIIGHEDIAWLDIPHFDIGIVKKLPEVS